MIHFEAILETNAFQKVQSSILGLKAGLISNAHKGLQEVGEQYYGIIVSRMGEYSGNEMVYADVFWQALSLSWLEEKRKEGLVEEIWEATGETKQSVRIFGVEAIPNGYMIFVGLRNVSPGIMEKAIQNEFGAITIDKKIPPRPLFMPGAREMIFNPVERQKIIEVFKRVAREAVRGLGKS